MATRKVSLDYLPSHPLLVSSTYSCSSQIKEIVVIYQRTPNTPCLHDSELERFMTTAENGDPMVAPSKLRRDNRVAEISIQEI
ncbi:hypothetical protein J6590_046496 [Homalodisca vitripennis]|nr:hypothetical protein J6590_046496 [Homalodisca vitripennis]